jgi:hypothetical protein
LVCLVALLPFFLYRCKELNLPINEKLLLQIDKAMDVGGGLDTLV